MQNKLTWEEWAGVLVIGGGLGLLTTVVVNTQTDTKASHNVAMVLGGTALYALGVGIGAGRPEQGYLSALVPTKS